MSEVAGARVRGEGRVSGEKGVALACCGKKFVLAVGCLPDTNSGEGTRFRPVDTYLYFE